MIPRISLLLLSCFVCAAAPRAWSQSPAEPVRMTVDTVRVEGRRIEFGTRTVVTGRGDLQHALEQLGVQTIRRGVSLTADVYADGFKRADLPVVVDGERFHCACPNRMDPPTSLALPIDIAAVSWDRTSHAIGAGLGGELAMSRRALAGPAGWRGGIEGDLMRSREGTATAAVEGHDQRLSGKWTAGRSYRDGDDRSFGSRYGYRDADVSYRQADLAYRGGARDWEWGAQGSFTRDVPYAFLLMDERANDLWNASLSRGTTKVYVNRSRHLMDNGLRRSTMAMTTSADQVTAGLTGHWVGSDLEAYAREWNANNTIVMGTARAENHMLPRYRQWSANASRTLASGPIQAAARLGVTRAVIRDEAGMAFYRTLQPDAKAERWFVPFALSANRVWVTEAGTRAGVLAEIASEAPTAEQLFIKVHRPGMPATKKPEWSGNPRLAAPVRASLRGQFHASLAELELGGAWVRDYALPVARRTASGPWSTYEGIRAALLSGRAGGHAGFAEWNTAYTLGWNLSRRVPLAEISPFEASVAMRPALGPGWEGLLRLTVMASQRRLDPALGETGTPAWSRLDAGVEWVPAPGARATLTVENLADATYASHLSYLRDPFAAGLRVNEPGRTFRLGVTFER